MLLDLMQLEKGNVDLRSMPQRGQNQVFAEGKLLGQERLLTPGGEGAGKRKKKESERTLNFRANCNQEN